MQRAADGGSDGRHALHDLCRIYWPPVYHYFRRSVADRHRAEDLTQGLFARLLADRSLAQADPARGRFRTWLLACAQHHLANQHAAENAIKRGGQANILPLDFGREEGRLGDEPVSSDERPEQAFARRWVTALVDRVLSELGLAFERRGRRRVFDAARAFLDPACDPGPMREAARTAGVHEGAFKVAVHRLRQQFHDRLGDEIRQTLDDSGQFDDELAHLRSLLARS